MRLVHVSDTHIRSLKYHKEYRQVFDKLYESIRKQKPDYIIHTGDIAHMKTEISPEFVSLCTELFDSLSDIAPTYILLGNHDGNLKSLYRQDAITPIVNAINKPTLTLLKDAGPFPINGTDVVLHPLSVFDKDNWGWPVDPKKINVCLFHGVVGGAVTDLGFQLQSEKMSAKSFDEYDYVLLGDIHKHQFLKPNIAYAGSTIQQNFGEHPDKGYLVWNIESKTKFSTEYITFRNPKPFLIRKIDRQTDLDNLSIDKFARLRLDLKDSFTVKEIEDIKKKVQSKYKTTSIICSLTNLFIKKDEEEIIHLSSIKEQEKLFEEYLGQFELDEGLIKKILELNKELDEQVEDKYLNQLWNLKSFKWSNLFNYGEDNEINFEDLKGIVGIFGKNYSGKSSVIDSLLFTLFGSCSKNIRKNYDYINEQKQNANGYVSFTIDGSNYEINRALRKQEKKKRNGEVVKQTSTVLDFGKDGTLINGPTKPETEKEIRKYVGNLENFKLTSFSSQLEPFNFINEKNTARKETISKFLGVDVFKKKHDLAKQDYLFLKKLVDKKKDIDFDEDIKAQRSKIFDLEAEIFIIKNKLPELEQSIEDALTEINKVQFMPKPFCIRPEEELLKEKEEIIYLVSHNQQKQDKSKALLEAIDQWEQKAASLLQSEGIVEKHQNLLLEITKLNSKIETLKKLQQDTSLSAKILKGVPCELRHQEECSFVKNAASCVKKNKNVGKTILQNRDELSLLKERTEKVEKEKGLYEDLVKKQKEKQEEKNKLVRADIQLILNKTKYKRDLDLLNEQIDYVQKNHKKILKYLLKEETLSTLQEEFVSLKVKRDKLSESISLREKSLGLHESQLETLLALQEEFEEESNKLLIFEYFIKATHSSGIVTLLINKYINKINNKINEILTGLTELSVKIEIQSDKMEVYLRQPGELWRAIEQCSGAEKTLASMAIRVALATVAQIPKCQLFILDEPAVALDAENMESFMLMLQVLKKFFRTTILITHIESLKEIVDSVIEVDKDEEGFARIS